MGSHRVGHDWSDLAVAAAKNTNNIYYNLLNGSDSSGIYVFSFIYSQNNHIKWVQLVSAL